MESFKNAEINHRLQRVGVTDLLVNNNLHTCNFRDPESVSGECEFLAHPEYRCNCRTEFTTGTLEESEIATPESLNLPTQK